MNENNKVVRFKISGMHCVMCARSIELSLKNMKGIKEIHVNYATSDATLKTEGEIDEEEIINKIGRLGYKANRVDEKVERKNNISVVRFFTGFTFSAFLMVIMHLTKENIFLSKFGLLYSIIALSIAIFISYPIFISAFYNIKILNLSMDVMYGLGISISLLASILGLFRVLPEEFIIFDTAIMLGSFLMLGRFLEERARAKANISIERLLRLRPKKALRLEMNGNLEDFREIRIADVKVGDILLVKASEQIPADGVIVSGSAYIDTSIVTGEKMPRFVSVNDKVIAGTINLDGLLKVRVSSTGEDTLLAGIIRAAVDAASRRTRFERIADRAIRYFLPSVLSLAILASLYWYFIEDVEFSVAISIFISTIVVACPCALGLATPAAISAGLSKAAVLGILIKDPEVLEKINMIKTVVLDKTGTLTDGDISIKKIYHKSEILDEEFMKLLFSISKIQTHPLAVAISKELRRRGINHYEVTEFKVFAGKGATAKINKEEYFMGSLNFLRENDISADEFGEDRETVIYLASKRGVIGFVQFDERLREDSKELIGSLKKRGLETIIMSGDRLEAVKRLSESIGVDSYLAELTPEAKANKIQDMKKKGRLILYVGDGINDTPALLNSDIGVVLGNGTDVAIDAGDVVILKNDIRLIDTFIEISQRILRRIKLNLFWAILYNIILLPFAMGLSYKLWGLMMKPELSALAMVLSSFSVMLISLSIRLYKG
ncbi:MAG: heavy metal translocating P-type ATPase [Myxococcota bacterium]